MVEDGTMERLAERIVLGKLGPIGHTIRLTEGMSWDKILRAHNMSLTLRDTLRQDAEDVVQRAVEMFDMNMRSRKKNIDEDEIDRLQNVFYPRKTVGHRGSVFLEFLSKVF